MSYVQAILLLSTLNTFPDVECEEDGMQGWWVDTGTWRPVPTR